MDTEPLAQQWWEQQPWPNTCLVPSSFFPWCRIASGQACRRTNRASGSQGLCCHCCRSRGRTSEPDEPRRSCAAHINAKQRCGACQRVCVFVAADLHTTRCTHAHNRSNAGYPAVSLAHFHSQRPQACDTLRSSRGGGATFLQRLMCLHAHASTNTKRGSKTLSQLMEPTDQPNRKAQKWLIRFYFQVQLISGDHLTY